MTPEERADKLADTGMSRRLIADQIREAECTVWEEAESGGVIL